jgi:hypothetical protein
MMSMTCVNDEGYQVLLQIHAIQVLPQKSSCGNQILVWRLLRILHKSPHNMEFELGYTC